ncbi:MAG: hypothetical protein JOZ90_06635 [Alphaproteobacteria bacterium]|nr:hypothetical protein [Alphaproteobacteria bacterium]MBV9370083.1 hypothetical protein [Alphaproteobacteria bacterium]MBV9900757.1 hypothetical protein [Alphaproteobacteria bacterium]
MTMKRLPAASAAVAAILLATGVSAKGPQPKISMQSARDRALRYVPHGRIRSAELETEKGRLIYSFDIEVPHRSGVEEVQISALDGRLISRGHETPAAERRESKGEKTRR